MLLERTKRTTVALLTFVLSFILASCTASIGSSELTAPPPMTVPPTTLSQKEKALEGIGTICDIAKYGDGYLLLTHTGLYTVDKNLENRQFLDDPANKPFVEKEPGTLFERLSYRPNYEENFFYRLNVTSKGIFYICGPTNSYYFCGEEAKFEEGFEFFGMEEYDGSLYVLWKKNPGWAQWHVYLEKDGKLTEIDRYIDRMVWVDGKLCLSGTTGLFEISQDGTTGERIGDKLEREWCANMDGRYRYHLEYIYEYPDEEPDPTGEIISQRILVRINLSRSDGKTIERLECVGLQADVAHVRKILIIDDSHLLYLAGTHRIQIVEFSAKTN